MAGYKINGQLLKRVAEIYTWLDEQRHHCGELAGTCKACGDCCDFEGFDHRLFITPPELMYFAAHLDSRDIRPMSGSRCPYNVDGKCEVYEHRFAACRIFCCRGDSDLQSMLSETSLEKLKSICVEFHVPYGYTEVAEALNSLADD